MKKLNWVWMVSVLLLFSAAVGAQVIKIENGASLSNLRNKAKTFDNPIPFYQGSIGIEYLDGGWYGLSSSVGFVRKGGAVELHDVIEGGTTERFDVKASLDYLTVNTTFRVKKTVFDEYSCYIGVGPRVDFKVHNNDFFDKYVSSEVDFQTVIPGMKCELGVDYMIERYRIGLNFAYLPSFVKPIKESPLRDCTFTAGVVFGYVIN